MNLKVKVCPKCEGKGTHVNPAIDGHGLTAEDFDQDPDFEEAYMAGAYDVECHKCGGAGFVAPDYTERQQATLEFLESMEAKEYIGDGRLYSCTCRSCNKTELIHSAGTVSALFMPAHIGHDTWIKIN